MTTSGTPCPGCGLVAPDPGVPVPDRYGASPGCWERYGRLLARSYGDPAHGEVHQLVVDAYAVQHPRSDTRDQIQQVALCLMTLALFVEGDADVAAGPRLHQRMVEHLPELRPLAPPDTEVGMTVDDVLAAGDAAAHRQAVRRWAGLLWEAWSPHHATVRAWNDQALGRDG